MGTIVWLSLAAGCGGPDETDTTTPYGYGETDWTPYQTLPVKAQFQWTEDTYDAKPIQYYIPEEPAAVLWVFHGSDGGFATVTQIEWLELYNRLVPHGVAILLNESLDRDSRQWDNSSGDPDSNPDFQRLREVWDYLVATTPLSENTPMLAVGFSNGGGFTTRFTSMARQVGWDIRGFSVHNSANYFGGGMPGIFTSAEWDAENGGPEAVEQSAEACSDQAGTECPHLRGTEVPMDPRRFARLPAYSLGQSQQIFDELVEFEYIDADGNRLVDDLLTDIERLMSDYIQRSKMPSPTLPPTQIRVVWATHRVSSQHVDAEVDYLLDLL